MRAWNASRIVSGLILVGFAAIMSSHAYAQSTGMSDEERAAEAFCQPLPPDAPNTTPVSDLQLGGLRQDFGGKKLRSAFADLRKEDHAIVAEALRVGPSSYFSHRVIRDLVIIDELDLEAKCTGGSPCTLDSYVRSIIPQPSSKPAGHSLSESAALWKSVRDTDIQRARRCMSIARALPNYPVVAAAAKVPGETATATSPTAPMPKENEDCGQRVASALSAYSIKFGRARSGITLESKATLMQVAGILKRCVAIKITLVGYTDADGSDDYNRGLSERRAVAALNVIGAAGIEGERLQAVGRGKIHRSAKGEGLAKFKADCRRVEMTVR